MKVAKTFSNDLTSTAYHEAGHAVIAYRFGVIVRERGVVIDPARPGNGVANI
jgi:hypothetical protein